jgi:hypothetical protein
MFFWCKLYPCRHLFVNNAAVIYLKSCRSRIVALGAVAGLQKAADRGRGDFDRPAQSCRA